MTGEIEVSGVILSTMPIGEYDKRLVILTDSLGKIHVFARGAKRIHSKLLAVTDPLIFGRFKIFSGKNAYNLSDVTIIDYFSELKQDLDKLYYGYYVLEFASYFTKENMEATEILRLLFVTLKTLVKASAKEPLAFIRAVFEWKMFALEGIMPSCHEGLVCGVKISETLQYTLNYILHSDVTKLYNFTLKEKEMKDFIHLCELYHKLNIDKTFHSLEMIGRGDTL